jgi:hypothetical protein
LPCCRLRMTTMIQLSLALLRVELT